MAEPAVPNASPPAVQIALVDDDRNILTTLSIALQAEGFATRLYSDGETALKALLDNPPDLAVFDIKMPRMDGMELLRRLRETSDLPVIFLTSKDDEQDEEAGLAMGADDYIAKPFSQRLLLARIRAILRRAARAIAASPSRGLGPGRPDPIERGRLRMDPARHQVTWDGQAGFADRHRVPDPRSARPRPGVIKSRNQLMDAAYPTTSSSTIARSTATSSACGASSARRPASPPSIRSMARATASPMADLCPRGRSGWPSRTGPRSRRASWR
jgi:two-component system, OmpR family, response regulator ChvI